MLHAIIVAVAKDSAEDLARVVQHSGHIKIDYIFCPVDSTHHFVLMLNNLTPELVFIEMGDARNASLCHLVSEKAPNAVMLGFSAAAPALVDPLWPDAASPDHPVEPWPLTPSQLLQTVRRAIERKYPGPLQNVIAMLPAKAGCGASITLLNVAGRLDQDFQRKVLLVEADLRSGALAEAMNIKHQCSVARTLASSDAITALMWSQQVTAVGGLHLMPSRRDNSDPLPEWYQYSRLLRYTSTRYDIVMVDLPEVINSATAEVVRMARAIYVVTTPELPALQLARSRIAELNEVLEDSERIRIIVNRWHRNDVHPRDVENVLNRKVEAVLPNDYMSVKKAILGNGYLDSRTALGASYQALAGFLVGATPAPVVQEPKSKLLAALVPAHVQIRKRSA